MDPEQQAMLQALRGQYGQGGGFKPTQGMQFGGFQVPQHQPLAGPNLSQGGQGGGGGGAAGGMGGMMEGAQKLMGQLAQNKGTRPPTGAAPAAPVSQAGPPIVATQAEMGPFQSQMSPPLPSGNAGTPQVPPQPLQPPPPRPDGPAPYNAVPPPMTGPQSDRALPPAPMAAMSPQMQAQMPQLMRAGGELPDWLFRMPRMTGAMGL
jgi:hypothetical protein